MSPAFDALLGSYDRRFSDPLTSLGRRSLTVLYIGITTTEILKKDITLKPGLSRDCRFSVRRSAPQPGPLSTVVGRSDQPNPVMI